MKSHVKRRAVVATWPERALAIAVLLAIAMTFMLAIAGLARAETRGRLPEGVPDVMDPAARGDWQAYQGANVEGNPDFPLLMFVNTTGNQPAAVLMAVDARNGTEQWSLTSDPIIVVALFADPETITRVYCDTGFSATGRASGQYTEVAVADLPALAKLLASVVPAPDQAEQEPREQHAEVDPGEDRAP